jgi:uncharacterized membrane protein YkoI
VDAGLDEDEAEFGVLVFAVALEVLADGDGLEMEIKVNANEGKISGYLQDWLMSLEGVTGTFLINM